MNEILKIKSSALPDARLSQLPIRCNLEHPEQSYPPEFWFEIPTDEQSALVDEFEKHGMEYLIYEITDSEPSKTIAVCRSSTYQYTAPIVIEICKELLIDDFIVSDGGLSTVNVNGDLQGFFCFD